uniref:YecA family protein n=1 Tax=Alkalibacterium putridalgicola TaxID=426703 RepID=UPI003F65521B
MKEITRCLYNNCSDSPSRAGNDISLVTVLTIIYGRTSKRRTLSMNDFKYNDLIEQYTDDFTSQLVEESVDETLSTLSLQRVPKSNKLSDCLDAYTKDSLCTLAEINGIPVKKSWNKAKMVETLSQKISGTYNERVCFFNDLQIELLQMFVDGKFSNTDLSRRETMFFLAVYPAAVKLGLLFSKDSSDQLISVHSTELADALRQLKSIRKSERVQRFVHIRRLLELAIDLYGIVSKDFLLTLYRKAYPEEPFGLNDYQTFFILVNILMVEDTYYSLEDDYIASKAFNTIEDAEAFRLGSESYFKKEYYIPSREILLSWMKTDFRAQEKSYKQLEKFVRDVSKDHGNAMEILTFHLKIGSGFRSVVEELDDFSVLFFQNPKQADRFVELYADAANHSREWQLHGYTRIEMRDRFEGVMYDPDKMDASLLIRNKAASHFSSDNFLETTPVQKPVTNPYKNVSRNDPCPCGSGKKFKKCCGR